MTKGSAAPSLASDYLLRTDQRAVRVITLAGLVAPAVVIEPDIVASRGPTLSCASFQSRWRSSDSRPFM